GVATTSTSGLSVTGSPHTILACYLGNPNYNTSNGSVSQAVNQASTTTALSSSANPSLSGQSVTFTATVNPAAPSAGTPTGTVTVSDGSSTCTGTVADGTCTLTSTTTGSPKTITASYGGDNTFNTDASPGVSHTVNKANTSTTVGSSLNPSFSGQSV